jgi:hypothetical protein
MISHIGESHTNCQLFTVGLQKSLRNGLVTFCFIFKCILRNCQQLSQRADQSNRPMGNNDKAKGSVPIFGVLGKSSTSTVYYSIFSYSHIIVISSDIFLHCFSFLFFIRIFFKVTGSREIIQIFWRKGRVIGLNKNLYCFFLFILRCFSEQLQSPLFLLLNDKSYRRILH